MRRSFLGFAPPIAGHAPKHRSDCRAYDKTSVMGATIRDAWNLKKVGRELRARHHSESISDFMPRAELATHLQSRIPFPKRISKIVAKGRTQTLTSIRLTEGNAGNEAA